MRICMLADGESIHTIRWCRQFHEMGHEIHLITFKETKIEGVAVHFLNSGNIKVKGGNWKVLFKYNEVKKLLSKIKPDVLHSLYATSYGSVGAFSGFHPYVITPMGSDILISPKESFLYRLLLKYAFGKADLITSMAPHMKEALLNLGVPQKKIIDIVLGINTNVFNKKNLLHPEKEFVVCSSRNFEPVYNLPQFLNAIALVKQRIPNLKVLMLGSGSLKDELMALAGSLRVDDIITFTGKLNQEKVAEVLNRSHVYVTVSLSDGNSLSLIEAMACGAYPIASEIPANSEWVRDGVNGNFVKIGDAERLAELIFNAYKNYDRIIAGAYSVSDQLIAEKGTWQINMKKMENAYLLLTGKGE